MTELQRWLALAVAAYHGQVHSTLRQPPAARWAAGIATTGAPAIVTHEAAFLVDFLPVILRTLTRTGFVIDHVHYLCNALKPWIARRDRLGRFVIRRDPRDISRVWVLDPDDGTYLEVPYRTMSHPAVSVWEHRAAVERLRTLGRDQVDEDALFRTVEQMRSITESAAATTRKARRDTARRAASGGTSAHRPSSTTPECPPDDAVTTPAAPFDVIEQW